LQQTANPVRYDSIDRAFGYDQASLPPLDAARRPVAVHDYCPVGLQRPDTLDRATIPGVPDHPQTVAPPATQRQTSAPVQSRL